MREPWITDTEPSTRFPHYTRANAGEVLPEPVTPLGWTFVWEEAFIPGWCDGNEATGAFATGELDRSRPQDVGACFGGYYYINLSSMRLHGVRNPGVSLEKFEAGLLGAHPDVPAYLPHPDDEQPERAQAIAEHAAWVLTTTEWPALDADRALVDELRAGRPDLATTSTGALVNRARSIQPLLRRTFARHAESSFGAGTSPAILAAVGEAVGRPDLAMTVLAGFGDVESVAPLRTLWELSRVIRESPVLTSLFDGGPAVVLHAFNGATDSEVNDFAVRWASYLAEHGYRGPAEWELMAHSYETDPGLGLLALDRIRHQPDERDPALQDGTRRAVREQTIAAVRAQLAGGTELAEMFEDALRAGRFLTWRECTKSNAVRAMNEARVVFRELSLRAASAGNVVDARDFYMLKAPELAEYVQQPGGFKQGLADRRADWTLRFELEPPFIVADGQVPPLSTWTRRVRTGVAGGAVSSIQGISGCPGVVTGRARIVHDPFEIDELESGDILVAPNTDPSWTPLFLVAAAVVVDSGSQISHSVIVSRELGVPCVVAATGATRSIPDGAQITVDGGTGTVTIQGAIDR